MSDEGSDVSKTIEVPREVYDQLVSVAKAVYGGGYVNNTMTFDQRKQLRANSYRALKALGIEK